MTDLVGQPVVQALASALVHFVWQGAAIGLAAYVAFRVVRTSASLRYAIGVGALVAMLAAPVATLLFLTRESAGPASMTISPPAGAKPPSTAVSAEPSPSDLATSTLAVGVRVTPDMLAVGVLGWLAGVAFFSVRLIGGWVVARRLAQRAVQPASDHIQAMARRLADRLSVRRAVAILQSGAVVVPVMIGWLKPTIVLPMAALSGLSPTQMEALLAHELAHVRRHDYLVNLLQSVAEALLFYHPAVWWLSRRVRAERELCCDDLAVGVCDRLVYVTALTDLAAMTAPRVALAATDGDLLSRVRRLLGHGDEPPTLRDGLMPVLALALVAGAAVPVAVASRAPAAPVDRQVVAQPERSQPAGLAPELPAATQTTQERAEQQRVEELRRRLEDLQKELAQVEMRRERDLQSTLDRQARNAAQSAAAREADTKALIRKFEEAKANYAKGLVSEAQLMEATAAAANAEAQGSVDLRQKLAVRESELDLARKQFESAKRRFEVGLVSETELLNAQAALAKAEGKGNAEVVVSAELLLAQAKLARSQQLVEKGLLSARDTSDREAAVQALEQRLSEVRARRKEVAPELSQVERDRAAADEQRLKELYQLLQSRRAINGEPPRSGDVLREVTPERSVAAETPAEALAANEPARSGDEVRITIEGEPTLPSSYRVSEEGMIRLPFLGAIKVAGLTSAQIRAAVGRQLADRRLGAPNQVRVTVTRSVRRR